MIRLSVIAVSLLLTTEVVEQRWLKSTGVFVTGEIGYELAPESAGAKITFRNQQGTLRVAHIRKGWFEVPNMPVGRYEVTITSSRAEPWQTSVHVTADSAEFWFEKRSTLQIAMRP